MIFATWIRAPVTVTVSAVNDARLLEVAEAAGQTAMALARASIEARIAYAIARAKMQRANELRERLEQEERCH